MADLENYMGFMQIETGDMLIDDYDVVDEKQEVALITPDDSADEPDPEPLADDCMSAPRKHRLALSDRYLTFSIQMRL